MRSPREIAEESERRRKDFRLLSQEAWSITRVYHTPRKRQIEHMGLLNILSLKYGLPVFGEFEIVLIT